MQQLLYPLFLPSFSHPFPFFPLLLVPHSVTLSFILSFSLSLTLSPFLPFSLLSMLLPQFIACLFTVATHVTCDAFVSHRVSMAAGSKGRNRTQSTSWPGIHPLLVICTPFFSLLALASLTSSCFSSSHSLPLISSRHIMSELLPP